MAWQCALCEEWFQGPWRNSVHMPTRATKEQAIQAQLDADLKLGLPVSRPAEKQEEKTA